MGDVVRPLACQKKKKTQMATIRTEDASDRLHLSLLSSPKDNDNPNTGTYTYHEEAQGQGIWIVIINTGYNWEQFPEVSPQESEASRNQRLFQSPERHEASRAPAPCQRG